MCPTEGVHVFEGCTAKLKLKQYAHGHNTAEFDVRVPHGCEEPN
jgi:hypothetical protein